MWNDFKKFVLRGNVVDLAVAVVIGTAFTQVVQAFVKDIITPLIASIAGEPDFSRVQITLNHSHILVGDFINALVAFLLLATMIFFLLVQPVNLLITKTRHEPPPDPSVKKCPFCLSEVALRATRCAFCTSELMAAGEV